MSAAPSEGPPVTGWSSSVPAPASETDTVAPPYSLRSLDS